MLKEVVLRAAAPAILVTAFTIAFFCISINNKPSALSDWAVFFDESKKAYYQHIPSGTTQWEAPDTIPRNVAALQGDWDFGAADSIHITQKGVELHCALPDGNVGIGQLGPNQTISWHWPPATPWAGYYEGKLISDGETESHPHEIKWAAASWYRAERKADEFYCVLNKLNAAHEVHYDAQMAHCVECHCTPSTPHWTGSIWRLNVVYGVLLAAFMVAVNALCDMPFKSPLGLPQVGRMEALQCMRFLSAVHVVCTHYYGHVASWCSWGYTWVPWFFTLTGFLLTGTAPSTPTPIRHYILGRVAAAAPLFYLSLLISVLARGKDYWGIPNYNCSIVPTTSWSFVSMIFFVHAWLPCGGMGYPWNNPAWFVSCLFFYWILFLPMNRLLERLSQRRLQLVCILCFAWSFTGTFLIYGYKLNVFNQHDNGIIFRTFAATHPLSFWQTFVFGMCLRRLELPEWTANWCTPTSLVAIILVFMCKPWNLYFWWEHGLLLPVHGALIIGLSAGQDPISRFFKKLSWLGDMSYGIYILQNPVWPLLPYIHLWLEPLIPSLVAQSQYLSLVIFVVISFLVYHLYERPAVHLTKSFAKRWVQRSQRLLPL